MSATTKLQDELWLARKLIKDLDSFLSETTGHYEDTEVYGGGYAGASTFKSHESVWVENPREKWVPDDATRATAREMARELAASTPFYAVRYLMASAINEDPVPRLTSWLESLSPSNIGSTELEDLQSLYESCRESDLRARIGSLIGKSHLDMLLDDLKAHRSLKRDDLILIWNSAASVPFHVIQQVGHQLGYGKMRVRLHLAFTRRSP